MNCQYYMMIMSDDVQNIRENQLVGKVSSQRSNLNQHEMNKYTNQHTFSAIRKPMSLPLIDKTFLPEYLNRFHASIIHRSISILESTWLRSVVNHLPR